MAPRPPDPRGPSPPLAAEVVARLLTFIERTDDLVGVTDDQGRLIYLNRAARRRLGVRTDGPRPLTTADLFTEDGFRTYFEETRPALLRGETWSGEVKARTAEGELIDLWVMVVGDVGPGGEIPWLVTSARDITPWLAAQAELNRRATHDELTGLAGRTVLYEHIDLALHRARRTGEPAAVLFIDVNDLKAVNDRLGHHAGDALLVEVARRLQRAVRSIDTVARLGGDEFVVLLDGVAEGHAATLATRIQAAVETAPVAAGDTDVNVSVSIGLAVSEGDPDTGAEALIRRADGAMYEVKRARHRAAQDDATGRIAARAVHEVAVAVTQRAIRPWYQPVVRLAGAGRAEPSVEGYQVLARWILPDGTVLPAAGFVPGIDGTGVAFSADLAVLREATRAVSERNGARLWVHVSSRSLRTPGVDHFVHQALEHAGLEPSRLSLEIADDVVVAGGPAVAEAMGHLRQLGARLTITVADPDQLTALGPSDVALLVDELRLGAAFVPLLREEPDTLAGVVDRARALGWQLHLCGIESDDDLARAAALGIDLVAGRHLGEPDRHPGVRHEAGEP